MKIRLLLLLMLLLLPTLVYAQASSVSEPFYWRQLVGVLINTAGVMAVVQFIKFVRPALADRFSYMLPIVATMLGPLLMAVQGWLTTALGFDGFDFTPITAALTGTAAVAAHQVYKQANKEEE